MSKILAIVFAFCGAALILQKFVFTVRLFDIGSVSLPVALLWILSAVLTTLLCCVAAKILWSRNMKLSQAWHKVLWAAMAVSTLSHIILLPLAMPRNGYMSFQPPGESLVWIISKIILPLATGLLIVMQLSKTGENFNGGLE